MIPLGIGLTETPAAEVKGVHTKKAKKEEILESSEKNISQKDNNNVTGLNNSLVDKLCEAYDKEYDIKKRIQIIREIDGIIYNEHPYVLGWYGASQRVIFWNKFNMPHWGRVRTDDYNSLLFSWWIDPEKENRLK